MKTDVLIIGAGLCGLSLASRLVAQGRDVQLVDARARTGGRILTTQSGGQGFDMGPAWFWPGQPRIAALVSQLGLQVFDQYAHGLVCLEDAQGTVHRGQGFASMQGSWRLAGGLGSLTDTLTQLIPADRLHLSTPVIGLDRTDDGVQATMASGRTVTARRVVCALPPRLVARIPVAPALPETARLAMDQVPTWMAGQAKVVATYATPFWRDAGLSGDASSRRGPLVEIHDASPHDGGPFGLFGFVGVPPEQRRDEPRLKSATLAQLVRLFGDQAGNPINVMVQDWASDPRTATPLDLQPLYSHPTYALPPALQGLWDGALMFSGTETAPQFGGYLEGALEAADRTFADLQD